MKQYSINDLKVGDIYEHQLGGFWRVEYISKNGRIIDSIKVNSIERQSHKLVYIKRIWFMDQD